MPPAGLSPHLSNHTPAEESDQDAGIHSFHAHAVLRPRNSHPPRSPRGCHYRHNLHLCNDSSNNAYVSDRRSSTRVVFSTKLVSTVSPLPPPRRASPQSMCSFGAHSMDMSGLDDLEVTDLGMLVQLACQSIAHTPCSKHSPPHPLSPRLSSSSAVSALNFLRSSM